MKLDINFNPALESTINLCEPLANWFERNQETMAYFGFIHKKCLSSKNSSYGSTDFYVLNKMANAALTWLEAPKTLKISPKEKAINAAISIASVYEEEKERLSEIAKIKYYLNTEELQKEESQLNKQKGNCDMANNLMYLSVEITESEKQLKLINDMVNNLSNIDTKGQLLAVLSNISGEVQKLKALSEPYDFYVQRNKTLKKQKNEK